jgi:hypothetical protein
MRIMDERCAGLDVHKKPVVACVVTPAGPETRTDAGADFFDRLQPEDTARRLVKRLESLGSHVT